MKKTHKFAIAGIVIFLTIVALVYTALKQSSVYYMTVPELKGRGGSVMGQGIRASGQVKDGTVNYDSAKLILNFDIFEKENPAEIVHVTYNGIKPDSFKADVQVILEGKYDPQANLMKATTLLVKCPSRYEGQTPPPGYKLGEEPKEGKI